MNQQNLISRIKVHFWQRNECWVTWCDNRYGQNEDISAHGVCGIVLTWIPTAAGTRGTEKPADPTREKDLEVWSFCKCPSQLKLAINFKCYAAVCPFSTYSWGCCRRILNFTNRNNFSFPKPFGWLSLWYGSRS